MTTTDLSSLSESGGIVLLDVGAKDGTHELNHLRPFTRCHGFEPNPIEADVLVDPDTDYLEYQCLPFALGSEDGRRPFRIARHPSYSSFLGIDWPLFDLHFGFMPHHELVRSWIETASRIEVPIKRLDSLNYGHIDLLKMDTQGTEMEVLEGAEGKLSNHGISIIRSEVSFVQIYEGGASFSDVDAYLRSRGFLFVDCLFYPDVIYEKAGPRNGKGATCRDEVKFSVGGDALYVLNTGELSDDACLKAGLILAEYRYFSFAKRYLQRSGMPVEEVDALLRFFSRMNFKQRLIRWAKAWLPRKPLYWLSKGLPS